MSILVKNGSADNGVNTALRSVTGMKPAGLIVGLTEVQESRHVASEMRVVDGAQ
jgi:hypothetical protein